MNAEQDQTLARRRLEELCRRCDQLSAPLFTGFLSPPEAEWALQAGHKSGVCVALEGGYEEAERKIACFTPFEQPPPAFPIIALELRWPCQQAPAHRDILGSVMGLGIERRCLGDIVLEQDKAVLFAQQAMAAHLRDQLLSAGRVRLQTELLPHWPSLEPAAGKEIRDTVASPRLDAVVAAGFDLARAKAAALVTAGQVKLRHLPNDHPDAQVAIGDSISVRGLGRLKLNEIGQPTRKGRYPLVLLRYGEKHA